MLIIKYDAPQLLHTVIWQVGSFVFKRMSSTCSIEFRSRLHDVQTITSNSTSFTMLSVRDLALNRHEEETTTK